MFCFYYVIDSMRGESRRALPALLHISTGRGGSNASTVEPSVRSIPHYPLLNLLRDSCHEIDLVGDDIHQVSRNAFSSTQGLPRSVYQVGRRYAEHTQFPDRITELVPQPRV
jgi:hypothetical protein